MTRTTCAWLLAIVTTLLPGLHAQPVSAHTVAAAAVAPTAAPVLTVSTERGGVGLLWTAVPEARSYQVFRSTDGTWTAPPIARVTNRFFHDRTAVSGTTYEYRVAAFNRAGSGPMSNTVSVTPLAPPEGLSTSAGDSQLTLRWTASTGATAYDVYRSSSWSPEGMTRVGAGVTALEFIDTGLSNWTTYYYRVKARTPSSESRFSQAARGKPQPPPPTASPTNLTATAGSGAITLRWTAVPNATGYKIFRSTDGTWTAPPIGDTRRTEFRDRNLVNGTQYFYKVAGYNRAGTGPLSDAVTATPTAPPTAPAGVTATAGNATVTLAWTPVTGATSYSVYRGTATGGEGTTPLATGITTSAFLDSGLTNGLTYFYQVTASGAGGESARSVEVNASPVAPPPVVDPTTTEAFQFLKQTTWGPKPGDVAALKTLGKDAFLAQQFGAPMSVYPDTLLSQSIEVTQEHFMGLALTGPDQLRQRLAWALHKIWVVSAVEVTNTEAIVTYHRLLLGSAFGNYRDLMTNVTLNPAMGRYLNMLNNKAQSKTGVAANENYARELMQLFTMGLVVLNPDGTPVTSGGVPVPSYTEADVKALARILTGWTYGDGNPGTVPTGTGSTNWGQPMEAVAPAAGWHDTTQKTFLGVDFPSGQTAAVELAHALDVIFSQPSVAPFISRQLIQQLVTSNPSAAYIADIAAVFQDNGSGVKGDLAAVVRAIVLHPEASQTTLTNGKLEEPVLFITSMMRAFGATVSDHPFMTDHSEQMGQKVFYPGSVFSYFSPSFKVRGTNNGTGAPLTGPEFQGLTTVTALERANFVGQLLGGWYNTWVTIDYSPFTTKANNAAALVDFCNETFMGGRMSPEHRTAVINAVSATPAANETERVRTAIYLTLAVAQGQVDR